MKFSEVPGTRVSLRVVERAGTTICERLEAGGRPLQVRHIDVSTVPNTFDLHLFDRVVSVEPTSAQSVRSLTDHLGSAPAMLAQVSSPAQDGSFDLEVCFFLGRMLNMDKVEIGVDEYVRKRARGITRRDGLNVEEWIREQSVFEFNGTSYFFLTGGPALNEVLEDTDDHEDEDPASEGTRISQFCLTGADIRFVASERRLPTGTSVWVATRVTSRNRNNDRAIRLATADVTFADWSRVGAIREIARQQNLLLNEAADSYIRKWDEFGSVEGEIFLERVRRFGVIKFTDMVVGRNETVSVTVHGVDRAAEEMIRAGQVKELELVGFIPAHIEDEAMSFEEFSKGLMRTDEARGLGVDTTRETFEILSLDRETRTLVLKGEMITESGLLVMSTAGETVQMKRRSHARALILEGRAANPHLGALIQPGGVIFALRSPQRIRPLTSFVRQKIFRNPPTLMQERAIDIALNTPDIALIQGPPGTGKTTVIAAILERLNELSAESGVRATGKVLLSAFQQDAVENMIDRISLNGIPVPKFGRRSGANEDDLTIFERNLASWCREIAAEVRAKYPDVAEIEEEMYLRDLFLQYLRSPSRQLVKNITNRITGLPVEMVGVDLISRATRLAGRLEAQTMSESDRERKLSAVRQLRVRAESFADDGPEMAERAITVLEAHLSDTEVDLLDRASGWKNEWTSPPFLAALQDLKARLVTEFTAAPEFRVEKFNDDAIDLAELTLKRLSLHGSRSDNKMTRVMAEFLSNLELNQAGMIDAISEYSFAFAATVQQSVNMEMRRRKGVLDDEASESLEYDYVIVDEAARVSPLDLMIPMAQGKRIILVGDHRQLPHVIDDEVARRMEAAEVDIDELAWLKTSLFQYMFGERLKALEEADGIQRRVTLDLQFRMAPELGAFVSRNFYERFDRDEKFGSGLDEPHFHHRLPGTGGAHAMWIDVPLSAGAARRSGTSWTRTSEVDAIVRQLMEWLRSTEGADLTYGVISFYRSQAEQIGEALRRSSGFNSDFERRVRVGTVDSFQGMEFDVVFLSVVRTTPAESDGLDREKLARRTYGHLGLYNRLNVSMSRQKKLLVVVGEKTLVETELAMEYIPGLVDFLRISHVVPAHAGEPG